LIRYSVIDHLEQELEWNRQMRERNKKWINEKNKLLIEFVINNKRCYQCNHPVETHYNYCENCGTQLKPLE
jgi:Zn finger protein HypA/HybF involved in hydrogenase expression